MTNDLRVLFIAFIVTVISCGSLCTLGTRRSCAWSAEAQQHEPCANPQTQAAINACAEKEYQDADAALNATYRQLVGKLGNQRQAQLKTAQLVWIKFRDAHCTFYTAAYHGGSMAPTVYYGCITTMTKARTEELQKALEHLSVP